MICLLSYYLFLEKGYKYIYKFSHMFSGVTFHLKIILTYGKRGKGHFCMISTYLLSYEYMLEGQQWFRCNQYLKAFIKNALPSPLHLLNLSVWPLLTWQLCLIDLSSMFEACYMCHLSYVMCHVSCVMCHLPPTTLGVSTDTSKYKLLM